MRCASNVEGNSPGVQNKASMRILRALLVVVVTAWALATTLPDILLPWHPLSTYGFSHRGGVITRVTAGGPAALAGLRPGDRIDLTQTWPDDRHHLYGAVYANSLRPNELLRLVVDRSDHPATVVTFRSIPFSRSE